MKKLLLILTMFCLIIPSCKKPAVITLSVDKTEISANGEDVVKFKVICNDEDDVTNECRIFNSETNEEINGTTFSTTEPNTYSFYATYDDTRVNETVTSNTVTVVANKVIDEGGNDNGNDDNNDDNNDNGDDNGNDDNNEDNNEEEVTKPLKLTAIPMTIIANGEDAATFTVRHEGKNVTNESEIYVNDTKIEGNRFTSSTAGTFKAYAKKGDLESNEITITVTETSDVQEDPIELSATPTTITANGEDAVTFTVKQSGKDVTNETEIYVNNNKISGNKFTSTTAGTFKAYAKKGDLKSNEVTITVNEAPAVPEGPIELTADKTSLKANGVDAVTFTVTQEGNDVTNKSEIFVNGGKLNGNKFTTSTAGTYTVYAKKNNETSNEITLTAEYVEGGSDIVFAEGVTLTSGWYDVNKVGDGTVNGDINMCWAASAANILQWWQDRYVAAGNTLPEGCPNGPGTTYELDIMEIFHDEWNNEKGGHAFHAAPWYFEGKNVCEGWGSQAQPLTEGGFFKNEWNSISQHLYMGHGHGYTQDYNNYYLWGKGAGLDGTGRLKAFSDLVISFIEKGMTSLVIAQQESLGGTHHSVTLWGYEVDKATGLLTKIYITDSDDSKAWPRDPKLHAYTVSSTSSGTIKFSGDVYSACYPVALYPISGYGSN